MNSTNLEVKLTGMGMTFNYERHLIEKVLKDAGIEVEIRDKHYSKLSAVSLANHEMIRKRYKTKVTLVCEHIPWGG